MDTLLIILSKDIIRRNIIDTKFWSDFLSKKPENQKVVLVVNPEAVSHCQKYISEGIEVVGYNKKKSAGLNSLLNFFIRTALYSHSVKTYRNRAFARKQCSLISFVAKSMVANSVGRSSLCKNFIRFLFLKTKVDVEINKIFDIYKPKCVFTPSMIDNEFDAQFAKVAKQRSIKLIGMVRSWDNFNNHGLLSVVPDVLYLQNKFLTEAVEKFQAINLKKIKYEVIGLPHYDDYYDPSFYIKSKEDFFKSMDLDVTKRLILLGGSDFYYSEDSLPKTINEFIDSGDVSETQVIFRPHPSSIFDIKDFGLENLKHVSLDDAFRGGKFKDKEKFINLMFHSDIIVNIASTLSIDAAVFDKPAICINFDNPNKELSKYEKVGRLYDTFDHYERLVSTNGVVLPESKGELLECINNYLENSALNKEGRYKIIEEFVSPFDGESGRRLSNLLSSDMNLY